MPNMCLDDLSPYARDLAEQSLSWAEPMWDPERALIWSGHSDYDGHSPLTAHQSDIYKQAQFYSSWMAVGFLLRNAESDTEKAIRTIHAIIDTQLDEPGMPYHGTFYRWKGDAHPSGLNAVMWKDYDPNWRLFVGLGFATILEEYEHRLPNDLIARMDRSLELAVTGEAPDRCPPTYSNIALMKTAMAIWVGKRIGNQDLVDYGEEFGSEVHRLFCENDAFAEYNSPTYYGVNLYALGFWRRYLSDSSVHWMGRDLEHGLWRDIARYYHFGLRNLCGPFTRSYGMDLTRYTALVSLHIWLAYGRDKTPFPTGDEINHEFIYGPCFAIYDSDPPDDVTSAFSSFSGPKKIERPISTDPKRVATAVIENDYMLGAEASGDFAAHSYQFHAVTAHWRCPDGQIGWLRLKHIGTTNARAEEDQITLTTTICSDFKSRDGLDDTTFIFDVYSPGLTVEAFTDEIWDLPGMKVNVETTLDPPKIVDLHESIEVTYTGNEGLASFSLVFKKQ